MRALALLLFFLAAQPIAAAELSLPSDEIAKQANIYASKGEQRPEGYVIGRSLLSYSAALPEKFVEALATLGTEDRWLDIGAGEGRAVLDYRTAKYDAMLQAARKLSGKAKAIAISIEDRRTAYWHDTAAALGEKEIRYLFGRSFRDYSREDLGGEFDVITDVFGGFSYTRDISLFMEKALGLLEVNGTFFSVLQDVRWEDGSNKPFYPNAPFLTQLTNADGSELKICTWLKSISCVQVTCETKEASPPVEMYAVRKTCDQVNVPKLVPVHFQAGTPPERGFKISSPAQVAQQPAR